MQQLLGMDIKKAVKIIENEGFDCIIKDYCSKRPVEADTVRVIRQRMLDHKTVEIVTAGFKTDI